MRQYALLNYLRIVWKWKWFILVCIGIGLAHGLLIASGKGMTYEADTTLVLTETNPGIGSVLSGILPLGQSLPQGTMLMNVIYSKRMAQDISEHFEFEKRYGSNKMTAMRKASKVLKGYATRETVHLTVTAETPQLVLDISYFCVENIQKINEKVGLSPTKEWVKILDPPELSLGPTPRGRTRTILTEGFFGLIFGFCVSFCWDYFLRVRRSLIEGAEVTG